ncbi:MobA/MobL family protein [Stenotrophomonas lacuserhaii]|uniref:MobA/MobL family protein n=1 Tax=Stenotrophomonas lacuserhaii TaxID=2760084 RepID=UPI0015F7BCA6|nr:MobA/MobL family protein [Stenotrophomonas lacuserhaii]
MASLHHRIKSGKKGNAQEHARYIDRHGKYSDRKDLVHTGYGNLPDWAGGNPTYFWKMADSYERANGAVYREHVIALPNELSREQLIAFAERMVWELVGAKPYQYAIHAPEGKIGGISNPHIHLMYSDRVQDGINRPAAQMFSRYNPKRPEIGGCRKDSGGKTRMELRDQVIATRKTIADLQNQTLAEYGHDARVDHRSLREQGRQRRPERHLGPAFIRGMASNEKAQYAALRAAGVRD